MFPMFFVFALRTEITEPFRIISWRDISNFWLLYIVFFVVVVLLNACIFDILKLPFTHFAEEEDGNKLGQPSPRSFSREHNML